MALGLPPLTTSLEEARRSFRVLAVGVALAASACTEVEDPTLQPATDPRFSAPAPPLRRLEPDAKRNVFWGDLHIHTSFSYDAYTFGARALPDDAYVYAKGGTIEHAIGYPIRASRPLDFAAVTDHVEYLGIPRSLGDAENDEPSLREVLETGSRWKITWYFLQKAAFQMGTAERRERVFGTGEREVSRDAWREIIAAAGRHDEPGRFTTFIAYEWTSMPDDENLHRNVLYASDRVPDFPYSSLDSEDPEQLWRALESQRREGMEVLAIPHNGNVSNGKMYDRVTLSGGRLSARYAEARMRNEPISEIFQVKGQSEAHPSLSGEDEFADFELFEQVMSARPGWSEPRGSYARDALRTGLELSAREGFNPYRFGVIGSSDSHNASSSVEEDNYHGKLPLLDGTVGIRLGVSLLIPDSQNRGLQWGAAGLAAIWAEENTRRSLFDAMRRRETYATSGPRITVRFFGGWAYAGSILRAADFVERAYAGGVPMGGELTAGEGAGAPRFLVAAARDPLGANLDRIQIVKGWVDPSGSSHERIYDVAASDDRRPDPRTHRVDTVGDTVDVARATYENTIGAPELTALWTDPDFDPAVEAFYYARVLEIPTPRWSTYDAKAMGVTPPEPATIQERAVTSAIWLAP
jgi:hypothetical protein